MAAFDTYALKYDEEFSNSLIGIRQRERVHYFFDKYISNSKEQSILEINCGTGVDALWLAGKGFGITASDASTDMILQCKSKKKPNTKTLDFVHCPFNELSTRFKNNSFDLIYSNFGGLNCINEIALQTLVSDFESLLKKNGKLFFVVMGNRCIWEFLYQALIGKFSKARRRFKKDGVLTILENEQFKTYYHSPSAFKNIFNKRFKTLTLKPIGLTIPPSYLENYFKNNKRKLSFLTLLERNFGYSCLSNFADHYLIIMEKKT